MANKANLINQPFKLFYTKLNFHFQVIHLDHGLSGLPMVYTPPLNAHIPSQGQRFHVDTTLLANMGLPPTHFFELNSTSVRNFVFVTACDRSHFNEATAAIRSVQLMFPGYQIHYYDLGLRDEEIVQVS